MEQNKQTSPAHPPLPWHVAVEQHRYGDLPGTAAPRYRVQTEGRTVAICPLPDDGPTAQFIVNACNAHEALVEVCCVAMEQLRTLASHPAFADEAPEFNESGIGYETIALLEKAVTKAYGQAA